MNRECRWMSASRDTQRKMCRADVGSYAKIAYACAPVLVRNCSVAESMEEDAWHDNSCTVKPRPS